MIAECLDGNLPFGVVLIRAGREVGEAAEPYAVGTVAEIAQHERFPDGRMNILCVGRARFRIRGLSAGKPYLTAGAEELRDEPTQADDVASLAERLRRGLTLYVTSATGADLPVMAEHPALLSFAAPALLPLELVEQQALLEMVSVRERLRWLIGAVEREISLGRSVGVTRASHPSGIGKISAN